MQSTATRTPSQYQAAIYRALRETTVNLFVDAVAGSGKTTTLEGICAQLPMSLLGSSIFLAFNKSIQVELEKRLPEKVWVRTFHSIACMCLRKALKPFSGNWINDKKYGYMISDLLDQRGYPRMIVENGVQKPNEEREILSDALYEATRFARLTLVDLGSDEDFDSMCAHYDIEPVPGLRVMVNEILERGAEEGRKWIDFTDMIYLPIRLNISMQKFSLLMVDEAQDLSACQRELLRRMMYANSRLIAVGDPSQAIYGFAGAGVDSVELICEEFNCQRMPLSVCYRCPSSHLDMAREIVPHIEARENAPVGEIRHLADVGELLSAVNPQRGDLVMCRTNAPLVELAFALLAQGIPATLKGRDLLGQLVNLAKNVLKLPGATWDTFQENLEEYIYRQTEALMKKKGTEMQIQALEDRGAALGVIVARARAMDQRISRIDGLEKFIDRLYGSENGSVILSSVHKAKGLEADHTFILGPEHMPHRMATTEWAVKQEWNLRYVALTRGKVSMTLIPLPKKNKD